jgi:hypothetical protein
LIYKIIAKIIANHLKPFFSETISKEQYGFLSGHQKYDVLSITREDLHSIKTRNIPFIVMKLDISKAYDKVNWTFVRLALIQMGVNWIMGCIESSSFVVLINGSPSDFFSVVKGPLTCMPFIPFYLPLGGRRDEQTNQRCMKEGSYQRF